MSRFFSYMSLFRVCYLVEILSKLLMAHPEHFIVPFYLDSLM
ncbi:hypothetical protein [Mucilaginibacter gracilis]|nr:hypothetical protein [Mucilaginibacter gracilis]